jgi:hypothetical protein
MLGGLGVLWLLLVVVGAAVSMVMISLLYEMARRERVRLTMLIVMKVVVRVCIRCRSRLAGVGRKVFLKRGSVELVNQRIPCVKDYRRGFNRRKCD